MNLLELIEEQKESNARMLYEIWQEHRELDFNEIMSWHTASIIQLLEAIAGMAKDSNRISCGACKEIEIHNRSTLSHHLGCQQTNEIVNNLTEVIQKVK